MLHVAGAGAAWASTIIDNEFLAALPGAAEAPRAGIERRHSILPLEYIRERGNERTGEALAVARETPTDLACRAVEEALRRAGIAPDDVGLLLGDACSPLETTPAESQRVGSRFGLKNAAAWDLTNGPNSLLLQLELLCSWREERIPEFVVCLTTNTPTQQVNYRHGLERFYCSDGAVALVVSPRRRGRLQIREARCRPGGSRALITTAAYGHITLDIEAMQREIEAASGAELADLRRSGSVDVERARFLTPDLDVSTVEAITAAGELRSDQIVSAVRERGFSPGTGAFAPMAERWDTLPRGSLVVLGSGAGVNSGRVIFDVVEE